jgi:hypothetical protein
MPITSPIRGVRRGRTKLNTLSLVVDLDADVDAGPDTLSPTH